MEVGAGDQPVLAGLVTVAAWGLLERVVGGQHLSLPREATLADGAAQREGLDLGAGVGQVGQPARGDVGDLETVVRLGADQVLGDQLEQGFAYGPGAHPVLLAELGELQPSARPEPSAQDVGPDAVLHHLAAGLLPGSSRHGTEPTTFDS